MSTLITHVNTSQTRCGDNPWTYDVVPSDLTVPIGTEIDSDRWETSKTFIDALGKTYATVVSGDDHLGAESTFPFVINGEGYVNAKGAAYRVCEGNALQEMPNGPEDVIGKRGTVNCSLQEFDAYGRPTIATAPDGTQAMVVYGLDSADSYDHFDIHDTTGCYSNTYSTQRVDGLGRAVLAVSRYHEGADCTGALVEKWSVPKFDAMGNVVVAKQFERTPGTDEQRNKIARRAEYDTLGRLRTNTAVTFGKWTYSYNTIGEMVHAENPLGDVFEYDYDEIGRLTRERSQAHTPGSQMQTDAAYFYDNYPIDTDPEGLLAPIVATGEVGTMPEWAVTRGKLVASWDRSGISVAFSDMGLYGESWRMVFPDESKVYYSRGLSDYAGQLVFAEDDDGVRTTASYFGDGTAKSSFVSYRVGDDRIANPLMVVKQSYTNILGQTERVEFADGGNTIAWTGYDPVNHRTKATVVQQNKGSVDSTIMAFGYQYNQIGLLTGIADYRGRSMASTTVSAAHPTSVGHSAVGYHYASFPTDFDQSLTAPATFNGNSYEGITTSGWPIAAAPSDVQFEYDGRYQLVGEERDYITASGDDFMDATDQNSKRARSIQWNFDTRGSMTSWTENVGDEADVTTKTLGRALGSTIKNGWQLNVEKGQADCMYALEESDALPGNCFIPDAVYFAGNIGDEGVPEGHATCIWASYDAMGRMTSQTVRYACSKCSYDAGPDDSICEYQAPVGTPGQPGYVPELEAERIDYTYTWNARSQLVGAEKVSALHPDENVVMSYLYTVGGGRVVREKSLTNASEANIYQDVYLGGIERRHVQLRNADGEARSIHAELAEGEVVTFQDVEDTRELHYAGGVRLQWNWDGTGALTPEPQIFLSFNNHLGSTSAVIDFETGDLVEWNTNYAYGADESRWKNSDSKYDKSEEPYGFTGKEEDKAVGLHYFGARYYSSYLGRWLSPDPPVVHGGGLSNHYNYGANSPFVYVDPDGNWIQVASGVVAGLKSIIQEARNKKERSAGSILLAAVVGIAETACYAYNPLLGKGASVTNRRVMDLYHNGVDRMGDGDFWGSFLGDSVGAVAGWAGNYYGQAIANKVGLETFSMWIGAGASIAAETSVSIAIQSKIAGETGHSFSKEDLENMVKESAISAALDLGLNLAVNGAINVAKRAGMGGESGGQQQAYTDGAVHVDPTRKNCMGRHTFVYIEGNDPKSLDDVYMEPAQDATFRDFYLQQGQKLTEVKDITTLKAGDNVLMITTQGLKSPIDEPYRMEKTFDVVEIEGFESGFDGNIEGHVFRVTKTPSVESLKNSAQIQGIQNAAGGGIEGHSYIDKIINIEVHHRMGIDAPAITADFAINSAGAHFYLIEPLMDE